MRVPYDEMKDELKRVLLSRGFEDERAEIGATIITDNSCDGVYSHGLNRFPTIVQYLDEEAIKPSALPIKLHAIGALEQWDGQMGFGPINAAIAMDRAIELAGQFGLGCVALRNTNHWLRGGTYGLRAADAGCIGICMTNTIPNMPPWGGTENRIGNNPFILSIPESNGRHVLLDMAQSQFSFGKLQTYSLRGDKLPVTGGYDAEGNLTDDPDAIINGGTVIPAGYWKGSGLSIAIDMMVAALSAGRSAADIGAAGQEIGISQVFIAINPKSYAGEEYADAYITNMSESIKSSSTTAGSGEILYPGERAAREREENLKNGIPVNQEIWERVKQL
ncbi:3-dehydro-L-gulonate 2-dehydrogenase [Paenibacillus hexagrammi]|uniref:3-dehydro-L-gulonate 2-dehydrogenase n=1 Tax=Paenibacillus hexagrammi TaxID=2908839 RepID=A0ABY3SLM9_9BACL|nr:3-dehydro-L-gulonate 2-dehydrogenase [Paenibacillus sp. YPD9-1]UJF34788.1 3-dehydro-L-gulonate 2-dehydrogenase [Paenibacillus sp. YPD9-1]